MSKFKQAMQNDEQVYLITHEDAVLDSNGTKISDKYVKREELENIDLTNYQEVEDKSLVTNDKTIVGAINELFQSANNGKQLIANAIGEPLSSEDTFQAMSDDINSLLSTFKVNMMNNGVIVESGDKFKSLIDKIATMVEEGEGKGIQFASGDCNLEFYYNIEYGSEGEIVNIPIDINFTPSYVFCLCANFTTSNEYVGAGVAKYVCLTNIANAYLDAGIEVNISATKNDIIITSINIEQENQEWYYSQGLVTKWLAIGVGEEDTTLRDSLASILEDSGVEVTEEDDMASLISKVDDKIEELKNNQIILDYDIGTYNLTFYSFSSTATYVRGSTLTTIKSYTVVYPGRYRIYIHMNSSSINDSATGNLKITHADGTTSTVWAQSNNYDALPLYCDTVIELQTGDIVEVLGKNSTSSNNTYLYTFNVTTKLLIPE